MPQPRRLDEQLEAHLLLERYIACRLNVGSHGVCDVRVDMERSAARRPVPRRLCTADGPPREGSPTEPELARMRPRLREKQLAPAQCISGGAREGQCEHRQDENLRVPEGMTVVAGTRQPFRRDGAPLCTSSSLQDVEEGE